MRLADVLVLTDRMRPDGTLDWEIPAGDWRVVRLGYAATGRVNKPASQFGEGLEVDKLSASALDFHFEQYVAKLVKHLGPLAGDVASGLSSILVDSYEVGTQNWTQGFESEFRRRRGYDLTAYLPILTGTIIGGADVTDRFLCDFRKTVAELFAENYSGALARKCHQYGLKLSLEPYGNAPCDDFEYGDVVDQPMCEFWSWCNRGDRVTDVGKTGLALNAWKRVAGRTEVTFELPPSGSTFVVFRKRTEKISGVTVRPAANGTSSELAGPWSVAFPVDWYSGGMAMRSVRMDKLVDWTTLEDPDLRYFSGTATYAYGKVTAGELDLGTVKDFATVFVDGRKIATLWRPPYRCTVPAGELTIKVTNLWPNRMIGDDRLYAEDCEWEGKTAVKGYKRCPVKCLPDWGKKELPSPTGRHTFTTWKHWSKEDDLLPSGLLGPVRLKNPASNISRF